MTSNGLEARASRRAGPKLVGLAVAITVLVVVRSPVAVAAGAGATAILYAWSRLGVKTLVRQLRPMRWFVVIMVAFHVVAGGATTAAWTAAVTITGTVVIGVALAGWVTSTTSASVHGPLSPRRPPPPRRRSDAGSRALPSWGW